MTRILWHSVVPWAPTGYGQQTKLFTPRIRDAGYDVTRSAVWGLGGSPLIWKDDIPTYPSDDHWGNLLLNDLAKLVGADLVISLMDVWVLNAQRLRSLPLACWVPVDHRPCPPKVARFLKESGARPIAMSRFGEEMLNNEGLDPLYVPHGVDTKVFRPASDRDALRSIYKMDGSFIVGMVANNQGGMPPASGPPRKAFPECLIAFAEFRRTHEDAKLYLHTEMTGRQVPGNPKAGVDIPKLIDQFGIPAESVMLSDQLQVEYGSDPQTMAALYNCFDVLLNPSYGEGFGIPIVEAQACGTPVIVTDWTSMTELCGAGWMTRGDEPWYDAAHESFFMRPRVAELVESLEEAYDTPPELMAGLRDKAREFAVQYDADLVMEQYWLPALEVLTRPREVAALPNRQMRRAKKKVPA